LTLKTDPVGIATMAVGVAVALGACAGTPAPESAAPTQREETRAPDAPTNAFRDGEYSATGWYGSLPSHHDVTITLQDDIVTDVEITTPAEDETSLGYQQRFADALPGAVVGQSLDDIVVDKLAGSSGCSEGFMDALEQIKDAAAA